MSGRAWLWATALALSLPTELGAARLVTVAPGLRAETRMPRGIRVLATAGPGEDWVALARRLTGGAAAAGALAGSDPGAGPRAGQEVEVPFEWLSPSLQRETLAALLPLDRCEGSRWLHWPSAAFAPDASFEALAEWFSAGPAGAAMLEVGLRDSADAGLGPLVLPCVAVAPWLGEARGCCLALSEVEEEDRAEATAVEAGGLDLLLAGEEGRGAQPGSAAASAEATAEATAGIGPVPEDLLEAPGPPAPAPRRGPPLLSYGRDARGAFASYRLRPGEAIYSDVIVRFTGRVHAREVNELVPIIAERSGVVSNRRLPVGFEVRVPVEHLAAEYLPRSDPRRRDWDRRREEVARFRNRAVAESLEGVAVLLDAGHGGRDRGAGAHGIWESDYVYDIVCRIKERLEGGTRARVIPLVRNARLGYRVRSASRLEALSETSVLTRPPYRLEDPVVGVNLRWYLANSIYRRLVREGTDPSRVVFVSVHADSLHPAVRGAMVYVPAEEHTGGRHGRSGAEYERRTEVREEGTFSFSARERQEAEGLSRELAGRVLGVFAARGLPVHEQEPVRGSVLRNGRAWLPAVLRSNRVPTRILLEVCNLNHRDDNRLLGTAAFRQEIAEAYVAALLLHYGNAAGEGEVARRR